VPPDFTGELGRGRGAGAAGAAVLVIGLGVAGLLGRRLRRRRLSA
jgi:hypothetical protein